MCKPSILFADEESHWAHMYTIHKSEGFFCKDFDKVKEDSIVSINKLVNLGLNERPVTFKCSCELPEELSSFELWIHCLYSDHMKNSICSDCTTYSPHYLGMVHAMSECGEQPNILASQMKGL